MVFELKSNIKNNNGNYNEIIDLIIELKSEINNLKNENIQIKTEIANLKNTDYELKKENIQLKNNEVRILNENTQLKNEVTELKEKLDILWRENKIIINNFDSKIINGNESYIKTLKKWINPSRKMKAELLYRLSENGDKYSTFHELCDNKGPTLTLFHIKDGDIVGIYTPLSWDSSFFGYWKNDLDTFIFNLNKNQKYKKLNDTESVYCDSSYGPWTANFGCHSTISMKSIRHSADIIDNHYDKGSEILPSNKQRKVYDLIETEIYKIIFD